MDKAAFVKNKQTEKNSKEDGNPRKKEKYSTVVMEQMGPEMLIREAAFI